MQTTLHRALTIAAVLGTVGSALVGGELFPGELLPQADSAVVVIESDRDQAWTIEARSTSFTPWLKVYRTHEVGEMLLVGGALTDPWSRSARVDLEAVRGERYRIEIRALYETWGGRYELSVLDKADPGRQSDRTGKDLDASVSTALEARAHLEELLPPVLVVEASTAELMRLLPGNQLLGLWDPRWQRLRLQFDLVERFDDTRQEADHALAVYRERLGPGHPAIGYGMLQLAEATWQTGQVVEAGNLVQESLRLLQTAVDSDHPLVGVAYVARGRWLRRVGALRESSRVLEDARLLFEHQLGNDSLAVSYVQEELGAVQWERGDFESAEVVLEQALRIREERLGRDHPGLFSVLKRLGVAQLAEISAHHESALVVAVGENQNKEKKAQKRRWQELNALAPRMLDLMQKTFERIVSLTVDARRDLEVLDRAWALSVLEWTSLDEKWRRESAEASKQVKRLLSQKGTHAVMKRRADHVSSWDPRQYETAQEVYERSLDKVYSVEARAWKTLKLTVADIARDGAQSLLRRGELRASRDLLERVAAIATRTLGPHHLETGLARAEWANQMWRSVGNLAEVAQLIEESIELLETRLGADSLPVGLALTDLAMLRAEMGQYERSTPLALRARSLLGSQLSSDSPLLARHSTRVAWAFRESGLLEEMEATLLAAPPERSLSVCTALHLNRNLMLADLRVLQGELEAAKALVKAEVDRCGRDDAMGAHLQPLQEILARDYAARDRPRYAAGLDNFLHQKEKRLTIAATIAAGLLFSAVHPYALDSLLGHSLLALENKNAPVLDPSREADYYQMVGAVLREAGLFREAAALLRGAIKGMETGAAKGHPKLAGIYHDLAEVLWDTVEQPPAELREQDEVRALDAAQRSATILDDFLHEALSVLPEQQALRLISARAHPERVVFSGLLYASRSRDPWLKASWEWTLRKRSLVLDELAFRHRQALESDSPETAKAWADLVEARRRLATLWVRGPEAGYTHWPELQAALDLRDQAEQVLAATSAEYRDSQWYREIDLSDVARALPARTGLVEYVRVAVRPPGERERSDRYIALMVDSVAHSDVADLGPATEIDELISSWLGKLRDSYEDLGPATAIDLTGSDEVGRALREKVWDPVVQLLKGVDLVFVVLDGSLHQVHFAALPSKEGGFVVESGPGVHILSSGRDLVRIQKVAASMAVGMLAMGDPDFDAVEVGALPLPTEPEVYRGPNAHCGMLRQLQWDSLPESNREVREIAALYREHGPVNVLTERDATEERLKREAPGKRFLHVATHGFFLQSDCPASGQEERGIGRIVLEEEEGAARIDQDLDTDLSLVFGENPLLLSGLVLAGANHAARADGGAEDGIVTAEELAAMDLRGMEIAALSACDTGLGTVATGEGVFGLRRALEIAGARTILMSLWSVPDASARQWMTEFYGLALAGQSVERAAREASLMSLADLRSRGLNEHPYLWSGFVAAGDWR